MCTSKDIVSTALLVVLFAVLAWMGSALLVETQQLIAVIGGRISDPAGGAVSACSALAVILILKYSLIFVCVAAVVAIVANVAQVGFLFTFEPLKPNFSKLNPAEGAKKIFSRKNFFEFLKNCVKVCFLSWLLYKIIWASIPELLQMCYGTVEDIMPSLRVMLKRLAVYTAAGYIIIAIVDRIFQGKNFTKEMMMTKDEVKREYKEMEGSQEVKQAQREFRNELLNGPEPAKATKEASVVVTNPTHLAIGIRFNADEYPLPRIVVAGADRIAKIIRETAMAEGIPILEDVPLARSLYAEGRVGDFVPESLLEPVAEVLAFVKRLADARREEEELDSVSLDPV